MPFIVRLKLRPFSADLSDGLIVGQIQMLKFTHQLVTFPDQTLDDKVYIMDAEIFGMGLSLQSGQLPHDVFDLNFVHVNLTFKLLHQWEFLNKALTDVFTVSYASFAFSLQNS